MTKQEYRILYHWLRENGYSLDDVTFINVHLWKVTMIEPTEKNIFDEKIINVNCIVDLSGGYAIAYDVKSGKWCLGGYPRNTQNVICCFSSFDTLDEVLENV